ncbi:MAG: FAD/NAD(P)-binding protein [Firmicutes bacterium]|nr:FAD/NAD(P)-binding protein [Bacillota bacterium]
MCSHEGNPLVPQVARVTKIITETPDVKTFHVTTDQGKPFDVMPGQLAMVSLLPVGEAMFSVTWQEEDHLEFAIKKVGLLTDALHEIEVGQEIGIRGPYGNGFPVEACKGKDIVFIGGGIGLAPLRSMINYCIEHREDYGKLQVIYGARSPEDLVFKDDLFKNWPAVKDMEVYVTVDRGDERWKGNVGFVPDYLDQIQPAPQGRIAVTCGPPIMIKFVLKALERMGYKDDQVITTLEMRMKCGIGKCGRCNIGSCFICLDGPVFTLAELKKLPDEY